MSLKSLCKEYDIKDYDINIDGSIDVFHSVTINRFDINILPIKFRKV